MKGVHFSKVLPTDLKISEYLNLAELISVKI